MKRYLALVDLWVQYNVQMDNPGTDLGGAVVVGHLYYFCLE